MLVPAVLAPRAAACRRCRRSVRGRICAARPPHRGTSIAGLAPCHARARFALRLLPYEIASAFRRSCGSGQCLDFYLRHACGRDDFSHFASRLGLDGAAALRFDSPSTMPPGTAVPAAGAAAAFRPAFGDAVIAIARPLLESAGGGAFMLLPVIARCASGAAAGRTLLPSCAAVQGRPPTAARRFAPAAGPVLLAPRASGRVDVQGPHAAGDHRQTPSHRPEDPVVRARSNT